MRSKFIPTVLGVVALSGCGALLGLGEREPLPEADASIVPATDPVDALPDTRVEDARPDAVPDADAAPDAADATDSAPVDACACAVGCNASGDCLSEVVSLALGSSHACLVRGDGRLFCAGSNRVGQIADATQGSAELCAGQICTTTWKPVKIDDGGRLARFRAVSSQGDTTCALTDDGSVFCFGDNSASQCGVVGPLTAPPTKVGFGGVRVKELAVGSHRACAIVRTGDPATPNVYCWGANENGELGIGGGTPPVPGSVSHLPLEVRNLTARKVEVNSTGDGVAGGVACAISTAGVASCWGNNAELQASGLPSAFTCAGGVGCFLQPAEWRGPTPTVDLVPGLSATCAIVPTPGGGSDIACRDRTGVVLKMPGCEAPVDPAVLPFTIPLPLVNPTQIVGSLNHFCALAPSGIYCFGSNAHQELGIPGSDVCGAAPSGARRVLPNHVRDALGAPLRSRVVAVGRTGALAYTRDGKLYGWGNAAGGQFGTPPLVQPTTPDCVSGQCIPPTELPLPAYP